jgi:3-hydroxyisobutyrate dehydrogenase-like beta-hydroxyacid dehydrogenase
MSDISVIGLGAMGSALARALVTVGHSVTVWNRSSEKTVPLTAVGAQGAENVSEAVLASPLVLVSIDNYSATRALFSADDVVPHLSGRTVVQLSTGTPKEAHDSEDWLKDCQADYLDGALMFYPDKVGAAEAQILIAGQKATFERCEEVLRCLGGDLRYLGENVGAAAAIDLAHLSESLGKYVGFAHGARLCEAEGVAADILASTFEEGERARQLAEIIHAGAYELASLHPGASIRVWEGVVQRLQTQARDAKISSEFPDNISGIFKRAIALGHGEEDLAGLIKALRD